MFSALHDFQFEENNVADVSMLGKVHTLNLSSPKRIDISIFNKVHAFQSETNNVVDVSMLGGVSDNLQ